MKEWAEINYVAAEHGYFEIVKIVSPLMDNPNCNWAGDVLRLFTPIYQASKNGQLEIVKFLVPLSNNLDAEALQLTGGIILML